ERAPAQILLYLRADERQSFGEGKARLELAGIPLGDEIGMIAILLAPARVDAGGENVGIGDGREPGRLISGRQGDMVEPVDLVPIRDPGALGAVIGPVPAQLAARDARHAFFHMDQTRAHAGHNARLRDWSPRVPFTP